LVYKACEFLKMAIANALVEIVPRVLIIFLLCNKIQRLENEVD
jgi:energy-converting hydrogenase Eha subunit C